MYKKYQKYFIKKAMVSARVTKIVLSYSKNMFTSVAYHTQTTLSLHTKRVTSFSFWGQTHRTRSSRIWASSARFMVGWFRLVCCYTRLRCVIYKKRACDCKRMRAYLRNLMKIFQIAACSHNNANYLFLLNLCRKKSKKF